MEAKVEHKLERMDRLRKRPRVIRYHYLAVGDKNLHVGLSHAGLSKSDKVDNISALFLTDLVTRKVQKVDVAKFLIWWRINYQNPDVEYIETEVS